MMAYDEWAPIYAAIRAEFGYEQADDERVASSLAGYLSPSVTSRLSFDGDEVAIVVGSALDLAGIRSLGEVDRVVATADALSRLEMVAIEPSIVVTDLDSDPARVCARSRRGQLVAVHAHGDNATEIDRWVPRMAQDQLIGTTQARPHRPLVNAGGFTDGDRAAYLADAFGADTITLVGWDLGDPTVGSTKRAKLDWAIRLLTWLEDRRGERYDALDGHRSTVDDRPR